MILFVTREVFNQNPGIASACRISERIRIATEKVNPMTDKPLDFFRTKFFPVSRMPEVNRELDVVFCYSLTVYVFHTRLVCTDWTNNIVVTENSLMQFIHPLNLELTLTVLTLVRMWEFDFGHGVCVVIILYNFQDYSPLLLPIYFSI